MTGRLGIVGGKHYQYQSGQLVWQKGSMNLVFFKGGSGGSESGQILVTEFPNEAVGT